MAAIPSTSISLPGDPFIGESLDLTIGFDNMGDVTGYGPFVLFYIDSTGADGDDGLTFNSASFLDTDVTTTTITLDNTGSSTFTAEMLNVITKLYISKYSNSIKAIFYLNQISFLNQCT